MRDVEKLQDIYERTRRIETRLTRFLSATGFETGGRKPEFMPAAEDEDGFIQAPNAAVSLVDCLGALPADQDPELPIPVVVDGDVIGYVMAP